MKTIIRILFLYGIIVITTFGCEKNQEYDPFSIIGKWDWIGTIGDPGSYYPTEDFQQMGEYTKDSIHRGFKNEIPVSSVNPMVFMNRSSEPSMITRLVMKKIILNIQIITL